MKRTLSVLLGAALAATPIAVVTAPVASASPKIIGGSQAQNPGYVARLKSSVYCSATLVASHWILTARHCIGGTMEFHIGDNSATGGKVASGTQTVSWSGGDIALVRLTSDVSGPFAKLSNSASDANVGDRVTVYGWGATQKVWPNGSESPYQSPTLKQASFNLSSTSAGDNDGKPGLKGGTTRGGGAVAGGDSGGPMLNGSGVQVGVASTSDRETYTVYASVSRAYDWIQQNIRN